MYELKPVPFKNSAAGKKANCGEVGVPFADGYKMDRPPSSP